MDFNAVTYLERLKNAKTVSRTKKLEVANFFLIFEDKLNPLQSNNGFNLFAKLF